MNFTEQREELVARHEENRKAEAKIRDLIQTLDLRKDEAIERTFKVGRHRSPWPTLAKSGQLNVTPWDCDWTLRFIRTVWLKHVRCLL